jgi:PmbA protein
MARPPELLHAALERARARGARAAEVGLRTEGARSLHLDRGRIEARPADRGTTTTRALTVQVWLDAGQSGTARGTTDEVDALIDAALQQASGAAPDAFGGPVTGLGVPARGLGVDDQRLPTITEEDRHEVLLLTERALRMADRRLVIESLAYTEQRTDRWYASTRNLVLNEPRTEFSLRGRVRFDDDTPLTLTDAVVATSFASIATVPFGTNLGRRAVGITQRPAALPDRLRVLLPPHVVAAIFSRIADEFDASTFDARRGFIGRNHGRSLFDPRIHVLDDAGLPGALRTTAFDDRGVPPVPITLIREGLVDQMFISPELARARGSRPTGHWRGDRNQPSNVLIRPGAKSINVTLNEQRDAVLWIDHVEDLTGLDLEAGTLSWTVSGRVFRGQTVEGGFRNLRMTGDLEGLFGRVVEITSDSDRVGHVDAPSMVIDGFVLA